MQVAERSLQLRRRPAPLRNAWPMGLSRKQLRQKRLLDLSVAALLLVLVAPLWILSALLVLATSPGPVLFRQPRIGFRGRVFVLFKFRSMVLSSDETHREFVRQWIRDGEKACQPSGAYKITRDPRITFIGRILRRYSLDELPQLLNVLRGEMSMVGPRPAMSYEVAEYRPSQMRRLEALPGITGLWQVSGRNRLSFERMLELDIAYVRTWSLFADLRILLLTIPVVLRGTGH